MRVCAPSAAPPYELPGSARAVPLRRYPTLKDAGPRAAPNHINRPHARASAEPQVLLDSTATHSQHQVRARSEAGFACDIPHWVH